MFMGSTERLARWVASLDSRIQEAEAELARPLCSPWLRCACGVFQAARLVMVMRDGVTIAAASASVVWRAAQAGNIRSIAEAGNVAAASARTAAHAGITALRSMSVAASSARGALFVIGERHDRI